MMSNKLLRVMDITKTGAWIAFGCLSVLILLFPFVGLPLAFMFYPDERPSNAYMGLGVLCAIYLALYFLFRLLIVLYPWWSLRKRITKILTVAVPLIMIIAITVPSIMIHQKNNYFEVIRHFETNWKLEFRDDIKLKYDKSRSFGFVGGHDELVYAVFELKSNSDDRLSKFIPNDIRNLAPQNRWKIDELKKDFPGLNEKAYTKLYFEKLLNGFPMQIPKRFIPDWDNDVIQWGLHGAYIANYNHKVTEACLFIVFNPSTKRLVLYEFLIADH